MSDGNKRGGSSGRVAIGSCRVEDGVCEGISECRDRKGDVEAGERLQLLRSEWRCSREVGLIWYPFGVVAPVAYICILVERCFP